MPTTRLLSKLFQALSENDFDSAKHFAKQIVLSEEKNGHHSAAQQLRGALHSNGIRGHGVVQQISGIASNGSFLEAALSRGQNPTEMNTVMLRHGARKALRTLIEETRQGTYLASKGLRRRSKLLFVGPPGSGKSLTAQAVANELALPLFIVRFDAVIGAYLGQTATHLRELFRFAANNPCVLLLDEIDALGKQRGNPLDVGELDRIVIALMQELDFSQTQGIVIATSNLPQNLDRALWRRFDLIINFPKPTKRELAAYEKMKAAKLGLKRRLRFGRNVSTYADAEKLVEAEARRLALKHLRAHGR